MAQLKETTIKNSASILNDTKELKIALNGESGKISLDAAEITFENGISNSQHADLAAEAIHAQAADKLVNPGIINLDGYSVTTNLQGTSTFSFNGSESQRFAKMQNITECKNSITALESKVNQINSSLTSSITALSGTINTKIDEIKNNYGDLFVDHCGGRGPAIVTNPTYNYKKKKKKFFGRVWKMTVEDVGGKDKNNTNKDVIRIYHEMKTNYLNVDEYESKEWKGNFISATTICVAESDIRLKENIKDSHTSGLDLINQIKIREFDWKATGAHQKLGFVADELEQIDPALTNGGGYDENGNMITKCVESFYLQGYEVKAIQELYQENQELKKQLAVLTEKVNKLEHM